MRATIRLRRRREICGITEYQLRDGYIVDFCTSGLREILGEEPKYYLRVYTTLPPEGAQPVTIFANQYVRRGHVNSDPKKYGSSLEWDWQLKRGWYNTFVNTRRAALSLLGSDTLHVWITTGDK